MPARPTNKSQTPTGGSGSAEQASPSPSEPPATEASEQASIPRLMPPVDGSLLAVDPPDLDRTTGIGGSDAAAILGISPFKDATRLNVWMEKTHHPLWTPKTQTPAMHWGKLLEPVLRAEYARSHRVDVAESPGRLRHPNGIQFATPDGFVFEGGELRGLWEGKTASDEEYGDWGAGIPEHYVPQVQQYLAVTGLPWCDLSVLLPGGDFRTFRLDSDIGYQIDLEERIVDFWARYVVPNVVPPEGRGMPELVFPRQHEPESRLTVAPGTALDGIVVELLEKRAQRVALEFEEAALASRAKMVIGEHAGADSPTWTVHWRQSKAGEKVGWEAVATTLWNYLAVIRRVIPDWESGPAAEYLSPHILGTITGLYTVSGAAVRPFLVRSNVKEDK